MSTSTTPLRAFEHHEATVGAVVVFPNRQRMVTSSEDKTLCLWDLKTGAVLKKMEGHRDAVWGLAVSPDGQLIASGDITGELIAWQGETLTPLGSPITVKAHNDSVRSLDFSPDGTVLASGSYDQTTKLWGTQTWQMQGSLIQCSGHVHCVRYSPSGEHLAIATANDIQIYNPVTRECVAKFKGHSKLSSINKSLAWTPDGTRLLSGGHKKDPTIREWDPSTWKQVGDPWKGHTDAIYAIAMNPAGTLVASASHDNQVSLWQFPVVPNTIKQSTRVNCVAFSMDGKHILSGGYDQKISEWAVPKELASKMAQASNFKIFVLNNTARNACITGDLPTAEQLLTQEINADLNNYEAYANRSFVMARQFDWDRALHDAIKSVSIHPSLIGHISKGIALCGKQQVQDATKAFNLAFTFTNADPKMAHVLFLIKAIALFNANTHEEAVMPVQELAARPNADPVACRVVQAYLRVQLGTIAMDAALHHEAADHFTEAVNAGVFFAKLDIHSMYEDFVVLFGWDLKSLWQVANRQRCQALLRAGQFGAALESYRFMMDMSDELTKATFLAWIPALNEAHTMLPMKCSCGSGQLNEQS